MKRLKQTLIKLFITFLFCSNSFSDTEQISSKNVLVIDGDTIILNKKKIRFSGIDAPESFFRGKKQTCKLVTQKIFCGEISKKKLTQKIDNQIVKCFIEKSNDRYNRILAECFVNNESLSVYMVKNGYAFDYAKYSKKKYQEYENFAKKINLDYGKLNLNIHGCGEKKTDKL